VKGERVAVVGFGIQGGPQACNMRDSGLDVVVGLRPDSSSREAAVKQGCKVMDVPEAVKWATTVFVLIPDMVQADVYRKEIEPHLRKDMALMFAHGAAVHWGWIKPPSGTDVLMIAPKAPGQRLRELYLEGFGTPAVVAVHQDATGRGWPRVLGFAKAIGCTRPGVVETTFKEETESDWFGEQVDLCGGADRLVRTAFEVLVENGYSPEVAYFEVLHELKLIVDLIQRYGITGMYQRVSETARYGGLSRGGRVIGTPSKEAMQKLLGEIRDRTFEREWVQSYQREGKAAFERYMRELEQHPVEQVGRRLRAMMWPNQPV
jgi:ketol-acid reductoisomerase